MFHEAVDDAGPTADDATDDAVEAASLLAAFETLVVDALAEAGRDRVLEGTSLDAATIDAIAGGDVAGLTVEEGAAVIATTRDIDADAVVFELRDHLLMGMTTAVLDVDTIAGAIDADLTGQEVQQALEGRAAMTLAQLAEILAVIETRKP
ncbi:hypothetical protein GRS48_14760 [Halorubrum sp. JWXQ-INN 858]|uniref:DUF5791 family protein n=1 Tax=Halorubrum sp. JWXQ-INN 858 TaxID=2690782 RepID=UPI0013570A0A|nr:DUF5791 family protein [Halorubrum sp. JWXQ-INN 858]MWV66071.1 hypothetical protein [Halorubrum sp. JWXQ-INN 858]